MLRDFYNIDTTDHDVARMRFLIYGFSTSLSYYRETALSARFAVLERAYEDRVHGREHEPEPLRAVRPWLATDSSENSSAGSERC